MLRDGEVSSGGYTVDYGCGIRVLDGEKTGYAYAESTDMQALLEAAKAASAIAMRGGSAKTFAIQPTRQPSQKPDYYPIRHEQILKLKLSPYSQSLRIHALDAAKRKKEGKIMKIYIS